MSDVPGRFERWLLAARPRTLPAAAVPVVLGTLVVRPASLNIENGLLALIVALALQIATNYANDYSDGVRGTDERRAGPFRLTASGLVTPNAVRKAAFLWFAVAALAGLALSARTSWWLVLIGVTAVLAGWFYTGGPRPYGYYGFGELFVMLYFGFVATVGTAYVQNGAIPSRAWWLGLATGAMAVALLEANNLRDVEGDQLAGKKTLAARLGRRRASWLYALAVTLVVLGLASAGEWVLAVLAAALYGPALRMAFSERSGRDLLPLLKLSAATQLRVGALVAVVLGFHLRLL